MKRRAMDSPQAQQQQPHYKIFVKMTKTVALDVKCTDTIDQIKSKIRAIEGIENNQQALFFAGSHLENHNRLADYNIMMNSSVDLYVTDGIQIYVKIPSVRDNMKLTMRKSQSFADVKGAIEEKAGIPRDEQILMYAGQQLEDHQILSQCGLTDGQTLHLLVRPTDKLRISVNFEDQRILNLDVKCWYTVADVKLMIENLEGLPAGTQILMHTKPGGIEALRDTETLQNQQVRNNDVLMLYQSFQFFIKTWAGRTLTMSMRACDSVNELMKKLEERLQIKKDVYYLQYRGRVLSPGDTLQKSKVERNSTVDIRHRNYWEVEQAKKKR